MTRDEFVTETLLGLPARMEKIERALFEQRMLITVLLSRSGLDAHGVDRAFALAEQSWEKLANRIVEDWAKTPEGKEARRNADEEFRCRAKEVWKEECLEEKRILPDPTVTGLDREPLKSTDPSPSPP